MNESQHPASFAAAASADHRAAKRLPFEVTVAIHSDHNFYAGISLNISEGGVFVATHVAHPVGTQLEIHLSLPDDDEPIALMTEVRWVRPHIEGADGSAGLGLRFVNVAPPLMERISEFVRNRRPHYHDEDLA